MKTTKILSLLLLSSLCWLQADVTAPEGSPEWIEQKAADWKERFSKDELEYLAYYAGTQCQKAYLEAAQRARGELSPMIEHRALIECASLQKTFPEELVINIRKESQKEKEKAESNAPDWLERWLLDKRKLPADFSYHNAMIASVNGDISQIEEINPFTSALEGPLWFDICKFNLLDFFRIRAEVPSKFYPHTPRVLEFLRQRIHKLADKK